VEPHRETGRIEGFSDAVFAIAITLLALDLKVPPVGGAGLVAKLLDDWRAHMAFLAAFGTIAVMWVFHHRVFSLIRRSDGLLLLLNFLVLLGVVTIPFWTAVTVAYVRDPEQRVAAMIHSGTYVLISIFLSLLWRHAVDHRLLESEADPQTVRNTGRLFAILPVLYLASFFLVASSNLTGGAILNGLIALFLILQK